MNCFDPLRVIVVQSVLLSALLGATLYICVLHARIDRLRDAIARATKGLQ